MSSAAEEEREARCCSAEEIFELCEGSLEPGRERAVREHLRRCSACGKLHEQEMSLSAALSGPGERKDVGAARSAARKVALALPTRSAAARAVWGAGAAALLVAALFSLALHSVQPISFITDFMATLWGLTSGVSDAAGILLVVAGPTILVALIVGAFVDVLIAATLLAVARWWRPRGV